MTAPYIPPTSNGLDSWSANFSTLITANPSRYGLAPLDATTIAAAVLAYHNAYLVGGTIAGGKVPVNPSTRTPVTVAAMRSAQGALVPLLRAYASQIGKNPGVLNADKLALGLNLANNTPSPVPVPVSNPMLTLVQANHLTMQFSYKDSLSPSTKGKAPGAIYMQLVGKAWNLLLPIPIIAPVNPDIQPTLATPTKSPFLLTLQPGDVGNTLTVWGRWVTRKGLVGPWSPSFSAVII